MKIIQNFFNNKVKVFKSEIYTDNRGFFTENFNILKLKKINISRNFVQDNLVFSSNRNTLRGIHLQEKPFQQAKLVSVLQGEILDIVVDLRIKSKSFGKYELIKLSRKNMHQIYIPENFGHGYVTLSKNSLVSYKVSKFYVPNKSLFINYKDPIINLKFKNKKFTLSKNDLNGLFIEKLMDKL